jgi:hypothetical protein
VCVCVCVHAWVSGCARVGTYVCCERSIDRMVGNLLTNNLLSNYQLMDSAVWDKLVLS